MKEFDKFSDGSTVFLTTLKNGNIEVDILSLGATINAIRVPDGENKIEDIVLGYDSVQEYFNSTTYYGMTVGRFANRIKDGKFEIEGIKYQIEKNDNKLNSLHSGKVGLCWKNWEMKELLIDENPSVQLKVKSFDGEGNWPGNIEVICTYILKTDGSLEIEYEAKTDKKTLMNLTNHSYFNLSGNLNNTILKESLKLDSKEYLEVDDYLIPTGKKVKCENTAFDFLNFRPIGERINQTKNGYDHCFIFDNVDGTIKKRAEIVDFESKRKMEVFTTMPSIQIYTSNFIEDGHKGKNNQEYVKNGAVCFETQYYPDSPNHDNFPSCVIEPGKNYKYKTIYKFGLF